MKKSSEPALNDATVPYRVVTVAPADLEFPDWSGHRTPPALVSPAEMHCYNESILHFAVGRPGFDEERLARKVREEFSL